MSNIEQDYRYETAVAPLSLVAELTEVIAQQQLRIELLQSLINDEDMRIVNNTSFVSAENAVDFLPFHKD